MSCYICSERDQKEEPEYACHRCGGLVCNKHGRRIANQMECLCDRCLTSVIADLSAVLADCFRKFLDSTELMQERFRLKATLPDTMEGLTRIAEELSARK